MIWRTGAGGTFGAGLLIAGCSGNGGSGSTAASAGVAGQAIAGYGSGGVAQGGALSATGGAGSVGIDGSNLGGAPSSGGTGGTGQPIETGGVGDSAAGAPNLAGAGGADDFADEHDEYGSASSAILEMAGPYMGGNVIQMNRSMVLRGFSQQVELTDDQTLTFFVYEADQIDGPYELLWNADTAETAVAASALPSPRLSVPLEVDKFYWIGLSMPGAGTFQYGYQGADSFASSALANVLFASAGTLGSSISLYMPPPPVIDEPVIQTIDLSLL
jgi:hypothetical protein